MGWRTSVLEVLQGYLLGSAQALWLSHQLEVGWFWSWEDHCKVFETFYKQHSGESYHLHQVHSTTAAQTQCMCWRDCDVVLLSQLQFCKVAHRKSVGWRVKRNRGFTARLCKRVRKKGLQDFFPIQAGSCIVWSVAWCMLGILQPYQKLLHLPQTQLVQLKFLQSIYKLNEKDLR